MDGFVQWMEKQLYAESVSYRSATALGSNS